MKKIVALFLSLALLLGMTSAFADDLKIGTYDLANAGDIELGFGWWGNQVRDAATADALNYLTENYPNITFNTNAQNWSNYWALMLTAAADNSLPDLMQQDYAYIEQWAAADDLLDLTPYVESGALDLSGLSQNIIDTGKVGDKLVAVCAGVNAPALLYNKTLTDELGIEVPVNLTWAKFEEITKQIMAAKDGGYRVIYGQGNSENYPTYYARGLGKTALFEAEGTTLTAEEAAGYYKLMLDGVAEGWMFNTDEIANVNVDDIAQSPMVFGATPDVRTWCSIAFSNQIAAFNAAAQADGIELGICSWPSDDPVASNYMKPGQFFSVTTDSKNPDAAVAVLNYLINDPQANILLKAERGVPANSSVAAEIAEEVNKIDPTYGVAVDYLAIVEDNSSPIFAPLPSYVGEVNADVLKRLSDEALLKNPAYTAEELGADFVESTNDIASNY
ncbi:MAG: extracellular solute-binding protein [Clostridia bacterium]|nr:extracellular solute-binding protein [Clostridia bacterium]